MKPLTTEERCALLALHDAIDAVLKHLDLKDPVVNRWAGDISISTIEARLLLEVSRAALTD